MIFKKSTYSWTAPATAKDFLLPNIFYVKDVNNFSLVFFKWCIYHGTLSKANKNMFKFHEWNKELYFLGTF